MGDTMTQRPHRVEYEGNPTKEQRLLCRFIASLVADHRKLPRFGGSKGCSHEPEVVLANIVGEAMKQPSKFFRLMMATYRVSCGEFDARDRFITWAMTSPNLVGADVLLANIWNALWQRDIPEDYIDDLREHPAPWLL
jgi:hypothetical protein